MPKAKDIINDIKRQTWFMKKKLAKNLKQARQKDDEDYDSFEIFRGCAMPKTLKEAKERLWEQSDVISKLNDEVVNLTELRDRVVKKRLNEQAREIFDIFDKRLELLHKQNKKEIWFSEEEYTEIKTIFKNE